MTVSSFASIASPLSSPPPQRRFHSLSNHSRPSAAFRRFTSSASIGFSALCTSRHRGPLRSPASTSTAFAAAFACASATKSYGVAGSGSSSAASAAGSVGGASDAAAPTSSLITAPLASHRPIMRSKRWR